MHINKSIIYRKVTKALLSATVVLHWWLCLLRFVWLPFIIYTFFILKPQSPHPFTLPLTTVLRKQIIWKVKQSNSGANSVQLVKRQPVTGPPQKRWSLLLTITVLSLIRVKYAVLILIILIFNLEIYLVFFFFLTRSVYWLLATAGATKALLLLPLTPEVLSDANCGGSKVKINALFACRNSQSVKADA